MATRQRIMLPYWWSASRFQKKFRKPAIAQPKINGNRARAEHHVHRSGCWDYQLLSSSAAAITSCPHVVTQLLESNTTYEFDGELYRHGWPHSTISGLVRTTAYVPTAAKELEYWIFDIVSNEPQLARLETLSALSLFPLITVEWFLVHTIDEIEEKYYEFTTKGFEGIIIRDPNEPYHRKKTTTMMKLKPELIEIVEVIGAVEEKTLEGVPKGQTGSLVCSTEDGKMFHVSGMTQAVRIKTWKERQSLNGRLCEIKYQEMSTEGRPLMPSFRKFVED